ncbi:MAG: sulfate adenylyltransferase [Planctomycetes bacterium]|nr:sulfate adenylyltransferase [Planctomycetota bacterium]
MTNLIAPHGGKLVDRIARGAERARLLEISRELPRVKLNERELSDLELIANGAFSPLTGFLTEKEYHSVVNDLRLPDGTVWALPITLAVDADTAGAARLDTLVALSDEQDAVVGVLTVQSIYKFDKADKARKVYGTEDANHPGVAYINARKPVFLGGPVTLLAERPPQFADVHRTPAQTRALFAERGWRTVAAFQTRNPIHRAHEYLTKVALEFTDGLLIHPLVGETKEGDIPADVRVEAYKVLLEKYYPAQRTVLSTFPAAMRYAGPREAIHHALARKNYGVSHFIVGRDHAGVGSYYGTYDAQRIFDRFTPAELGITPLKFEHTFWHKGLGEIVSEKTSPGPKEQHLVLSGTKVREILAAGGELPPEFTRPEVSAVLRRFYAGR